MRATLDPAEALAGAEFVFLAVPSQTLRGNLAEWGALIPDQAVLVSLMKGIESHTSLRMSQVIEECIGATPDRIATVCGPNFAMEVGRGEPSAAVAACPDERTAQRVQAACMTPYFRVYTSTDLVGCELGGAVKNVIALCVGIATGLGFGDSTRAMLITRGLAEIMRLGVALGAEAPTFAGLAGLGDLVGTCISPLSRNRTFGENLGRGMSLEEVIAVTKQTAEGVKSCTSILDLARNNGVDVPIIEQVDAMIRHGRTAPEVVAALLSRPRKAETA
jgi:glycerol-3-phosphate dehydrogenase (NAD(P)+)